MLSIEGLCNVDQFCRNISSTMVSRTPRLERWTARALVEASVVRRRISIQLLEGQVCIHLADRKVDMSVGHLLVLDCGVLHDVETLEEGALLLTISWRSKKGGASESLSPTQRHLDEEALSRMDDEGASDAAVRRPALQRRTDPSS
jgi:hypothetical protein